MPTGSPVCYLALVRLPEKIRWLFWEADFDRLQVARGADYVLARIHHFFRDVGHPELSERTLGFWRAFFQAEEGWAAPPFWRKTGPVPWPP